jgi:hypothetical protein
MASQAMRSRPNRSNLPFWANVGPARCRALFLKEAPYGAPDRAMPWLVPPIMVPGLLVAAAAVMQW